MAEREPWRHDAEVACLSSGAVKEGEGKVRIKPINGPGMCGADFPIKVSALGDSALIGYSDELRPPSGIPGASTPRWPVNQQPAYPSSQPPAYPPQAPYETPAAPRYGAPPAYPAVESQALPPPRGAPRYESDQSPPTPLSLEPRRGAGAAEPAYDFRRPYETQRVEPPRAEPRYEAPRDEAPQPRLGPSRAPQAVAAGPVSVSPAATLACPIVSELDRWIAGSVQPAAIRWFGQPVVEIKQISAYSCRGMNGNPNARISEHAFGNALDIASFTFADGHKVTVKNGWHGAPEEQGFLRDVQGAACSQFTTVLAPGSNVYHYDHIHVDLMRRANGRHACNPAAVSGEEIAARAGGRVAAKRGGEPSVTGTVTPRRLPSPPKRLAPPSAYSDEGTRNLPTATPGDDGED